VREWFTLYHPTTCFAGNKIQVLAWEHANPAVKAQIHKLRGVYHNRLTPFEYSLRLPLTVADAIALEQHLGLTHATEFIRAVDPWCYPGDETQAAVVLKGCVQCLLSKSRGAVKSFHQFSEESKSAFLLSPILIKERPALIRKPIAYSAPEAPPAPAAPVDLSAFPASIVPPPSNLLPACLAELFDKLSQSFDKYDGVQAVSKQYYTCKYSKSNAIKIGSLYKWFYDAFPEEKQNSFSTKNDEYMTTKENLKKLCLCLIFQYAL
jgi:hypothetical protein